MPKYKKHKIDWSKHKIGPGYVPCARCREDKPFERIHLKWCEPCAEAMDPAKKMGMSRGLSTPKSATVYRSSKSR